MSTLADALLVLLGLGLVLAIVFGGFKGNRFVAVATSTRDRAQGLGLLAFTGVTTTVAAEALERAVAPGGAPGPDIATGVAVGAGYAAFGAVSSRSSHVRAGAAVLRRGVEGSIGLVAAVPVTITYFTSATTCSTPATPVWMLAAVMACVLAALACAVILSVLRLPLDRRALAINLDLPLAFVGSLQLVLFFLNPFGLTLLDLPSVGLVVGFLGVAVVVGSCAINPGFVSLIAGAVLSVTTLFVDTAAGEACQGRVATGLIAVVAYGVAFIVLTGVLTRRRAKR